MSLSAFRNKFPSSGVFSAVFVLAGTALLFASLDGSYVLPLDHEAILYAKTPLADPVSRLEKQVQDGSVKLEYDPHFGYLRSVLRQLDVPVSSQILVFSKTSFQAPRISPRTPRAIYFNDRVSVGWVRGGDVIEISSVDPKQGTVFHTIDQGESSTPSIRRRDECLQCHLSPRTLGIPGGVVRSVFPDPSGMPLFQAGSFVTDHRSPFSERWGGWYVTGRHGSQTHMGNSVVRSKTQPEELDRSDSSNVTDLRWRFDTGSYLSAHSDIVALMVLEHQVRMQNLITRVGYETRMALHSQAALGNLFSKPGELSESTQRRINGPVEYLLEYLLFMDEVALEAPVEGTSKFAAEFMQAGPRDKQGRSLRDFDLKTRMFKYPCSYLIYSEAFDNLPGPAKERVYRRLWEILSGEDKSPMFADLSSDDRKAILEILLETKENLPAYWQRG
ncbi:MAG: hypothetical protein ACRD7E_30700 [Bryobacteraceae bacterium]